jgi:NADH-quinone oxidoreductase subunit L
MEWFLEHAYVIPAIPAVSFVLILAVGKHLPRKGSEIGIVSICSSFVLACLTAVAWIQHVNEGGAEQVPEGGEHAANALTRLAEEAHHAIEPVVTASTWWQSGGVEHHIGTMVDGLSVMMLFTVTLVSMLVHFYSTEYLKGDRRYTHYFAFLSLFSASMLTLVIAQNTLMLLTAWELVGLCSFVLIGHWWEEKPNTDAALKAFLTNRVGDVGLIIGVIILFFAADSFDILKINALAAEGGISHLVLLMAAISLTAAVCSKSGQFPLHTWLPDAMAGPTPVSALIHAATMVVAGVFMVARLYPVFYEGMAINSSSINLLAFIGGFTTLIGAGLAFAQWDIKKVLAYSTISQLGYMVMALGVGAWTAAVFHLFTHAMFKACLFLGAGSVSHAAHHTFDMRKMGGLKKHMPSTYWTFIIGSLALAGIFPLAGFWSKDEILAGAAQGQTKAYWLMLVFGTIAAFMTAAYMTRVVWLTFYGEYRGEGHPHESPRIMTIPLWILAGMAVITGFTNIPAALGPESFELRFEHYVEPTFAFPEVVHPEFSYLVAGMSTLLAVGAIVLAWQYFKFNRGPHGLTQRSKLAHAGYAFLENKYYLDWLYEKVIRDGIKGPIARAAYWFNQHVLDGVVNGAAAVSKGTGNWLYKYIDQGGIDRAVNASGAGAEGSGQVLRHLQTGRVQQYAALLFAGAAVLAGIFIVII